jgi:NAD(P)-dependent dehydrogenase (short-subunit alcohol dehydrogenase family)
LAAGGANVCVVGRQSAELARTVDAIGRQVGTAVAIEADVSVAADVERAVAASVGAFGGLDLLVHAAGVSRSGFVTDLTEDDWDAMFDTNVKSCFLLGKHAVPAMRARGGGAIVTVSSIYAIAARSGAAAYAATKAALTTLTKIMAVDHIADGVRINCVAPGTIRTPMVESLAREADAADPAAVIDQAGRLPPLGRLVDVGEVVSLICYLLSDESSGIVGACYPIDGGRLPLLGAAD